MVWQKATQESKPQVKADVEDDEDFDDEGDSDSEFDDEDVEEAPAELPSIQAKRPRGRPPLNREADGTQRTWFLKEVPTTTETRVFNSKTNRSYTVIEAIVELLNRTE